MIARTLLLAALAVPLFAQAQARLAGTFELAEGDILVEAKDGKGRAPAAGSEVHEGDTITTFARAEAHLQMLDGASLIVRENSKITITAYLAEGGEGDRSLIDLARGALRSITGWIGQYNRSNYAVRTPLVTIGVRGTDHEPTHLEPGDPRGEPGSYDKVNEGRTYMKGAEGTVEVPAGRAAFRGRGRAVRARLLAETPRFFRPGRFEPRFEARARQVRQSIRERREQRREFLRERRLRDRPALKERRAVERRGAAKDRREAVKDRREAAKERRDRRQR